MKVNAKSDGGGCAGRTFKLAGTISGGWCAHEMETADWVDKIAGISMADVADTSMVAVAAWAMNS